MKVPGTEGAGPPCSLLPQLLPQACSPGSLSRWPTFPQWCVVPCWRIDLRVMKKNEKWIVKDNKMRRMNRLETR